MERSLRARLDRRDDGGMSIVEVLIASVILLIALTAMLGLLMTSTGLSARARAQSLAVTTANRFIETVRQTTYTSLNPDTLNQLATAASGSVGGMTVSVTASMTAHAISTEPKAYQEVKVLVSVTGPGFKRFEFRTGTFVREWRYSGSDTQTDPTVDFDSLTPAAGATARPIWGTVHVGATAHSNMTDVVLTQVNVVWRVSGQSASYLATATPGIGTGSCFADWVTTAVPEGRRGTMYAEAWDALNQSDSKTRDFIIDNIVPSAPALGSVTLAQTEGNSRLTWTWAGAMDGETAVSSYEPTVYQLLPQAAMSSYNSWVPAVQPPVSTTTHAFASSPFSLYYPAIVSIGPREVAGLGIWRSDAIPGSEVLTRPGFSTMSVSVTQAKNADPLRFTAHTLELTPPTFKVTTSSYRWEYKVGSGAWALLPSGTSPNTNPSAGAVVHFAQVTGPDKSQPTLSFRCTASVTRPNGTSYTNKSAIMTVSEPWTGQTYTLARFTPDWTTSW